MVDHPGIFGAGNRVVCALPLVGFVCCREVGVRFVVELPGLLFKRHFFVSNMFEKKTWWKTKTAEISSIIFYPAYPL